MVMTIEPGIYVAAANTKVAAKWRGIGIRIEDDIALTQSGNDVLTHDVCKSVADIEAHMRQSHASSPVLGAAKVSDAAKAASKKATAKAVATARTKATVTSKAKPKVKSNASLKSKAASKSRLKDKAASSSKTKPTKKTLPKKKSVSAVKKSPPKSRLSKRK